jgi:hypothetical protein
MTYLEGILSMNAAMYTLLLLSIVNQNLSVSIILVKYPNSKFLEVAVTLGGQVYVVKLVIFFQLFIANVSD